MKATDGRQTLAGLHLQTHPASPAATARSTRALCPLTPSPKCKLRRCDTFPPASRRAHICVTCCKHTDVHASVSLVSCWLAVLGIAEATRRHAGPIAKHRRLENRHFHSRGKTTSATSASRQRSTSSIAGFGTTGTQGVPRSKVLLHSYLEDTLPKHKGLVKTQTGANPLNSNSCPNRRLQSTQNEYKKEY